MLQLRNFWPSLSAAMGRGLDITATLGFLMLVVIVAIEMTFWNFLVLIGIGLLVAVGVMAWSRRCSKWQVQRLIARHARQR